MEQIIRKASMEDVPQIHALLNHFADKGLLLGRPISSLYDKIRDFAVCVDNNNVVIGAAALQITWENLAEIRSLAVKEKYHGKGIGTKLVDFCLKDAEKFGIKNIFALTYQPTFFQRHDFVIIDKSRLPLKIWSDCIHCNKFPDCDETAMMLEK